jgi:hypothetical protein
MATIINTPGSSGDNSSAGWAVAVAILLVIVIGGIFWYTQYYRGAAPAPGATIQVNLPTGGDNGGNGGGGAAPAPAPAQ